MTINEALSHIQQKLHAPKGQFNSFGKYNYRSLEDIMVAVKPLLEETGTVLTFEDSMVDCGGRVYVRATAVLQLVEGGELHAVTAFARESESRKGMDDSQLTGATSSYARKYAANGLFLIDDVKDADTMPRPEPSPITASQKKQLMKAASDSSENLSIVEKALAHYKVGDVDDLTSEQAATILKRL